MPRGTSQKKFKRENGKSRLEGGKRDGPQLIQTTVKGARRPLRGEEKIGRLLNPNKRGKPWKRSRTSSFTLLKKSPEGLDKRMQEEGIPKWGKASGLGWEGCTRRHLGQSFAALRHESWEKGGNTHLKEISLGKKF